MALNLRCEDRATPVPKKGRSALRGTLKPPGFELRCPEVSTHRGPQRYSGRAPCRHRSEHLPGTAIGSGRPQTTMVQSQVSCL